MVYLKISAIYYYCKPCKYRVFAIWILLATVCMDGISCIQKILDDDAKLEVRGYQSFYPFEKLESIQCPNKSKIKILRVTKMKFEPSALIAILNEFNNLEQLSLENVIWNGKFKSKLTLPKLRKISIERNKWRIADCQSADEFFELFFFTTLKPKDLDGSWSIIISSRRAQFKFQWNQLGLKTIPFDLQQYFQIILSLGLENSVLDVSKFNHSTLEILRIVNTNLIHGNVNQLLPKLNGIKRLTIDNIQQNSEVTFDFSLLSKPEILTHIDLSGDWIVNTNNHPLHFQGLEYLALSNFRQLNLGYFFKFPMGMKRITLQNVTFLSSDELKYLANLSTIHLLRITIADELHTDFDLSYLSKSYETIRLLELGKLNLKLNATAIFQFSNIVDLTLASCEIDLDVVKRLSYIFYDVRFVVLDAQVNDGILEQFLNTSMELLIIRRIEAISRRSIKTQKFLDIANATTRKGEVTIMKNNGRWEYTGIISNENGEVTIFNTYVSILSLICLLGIVGNILSLLVLVRKKMRSSSTVMLIALSLFDMTILITLVTSFPLYGFKLITLFLNVHQFLMEGYSAGTKIWILGDDPVETVKNFEEMFANYIYPLCKTAYTGSVYMTVVLTLERFLAVCYPLKVRSWTSIKKAKWLSLGVLVLAVSLNACRWLETRGSTIKLVGIHVLHGGLNLERIYDEPNILRYLLYRQIYHGWIWTIAMYIIPISLLSFLNVKIWLQIRRSKNQRMEMSLSIQNSEMTSLTSMLLCVSLIFTICNTINGAIILMFVSLGSYDPKDIDVFSCIPLIFNSSINIIIYCTLGTKFRTELMTIPCVRKLFGKTQTTTT